MLDFAGFKKPSYHMMKSIWSEEPHVYMTTADLDDSIYRVEDNQVVEETEGQWKWRNWGWHDVNTHWNYSPGQDIVVEVYTNQAEVELFLNGKSQGVQRLVNNDDHILKWAVAYEPGELKATSVVTGVDAGTSLRSSLEPAAVVLSVDRKRLDADSYDVAHITAQVVDKNGVAVTTQERKLTFDIDPKLQSLGVDNGAEDNLQPHKSNEITTRNGRALLIVQTKASVGDATINVRADGLKGAELGLNIEAISILNRKP
jgi:beta-galactosidase